MLFFFPEWALAQHRSSKRVLPAALSWQRTPPKYLQAASCIFFFNCIRSTAALVSPKNIQTDRLARQEGHAILTSSFPPPPSSNDYQRRQYSAPPVGKSDQHVTSRLPGTQPMIPSCHGRCHDVVVVVVVVVFLFLACPSIRCSAAVVDLRAGSRSLLYTQCAAGQAILPARIETSLSLSPSSHALIFYSLIYVLYSFPFCVAVTDCPPRVEPVRLSRYFFPLLFANFAVALSPSLCPRKAPAAMKILNRSTLTRASRCRQRLRR